MENIYGAILGVMNDIGAIGKDGVNPGFGNNKGYKFRGIDQVYNALQPALIKNRVFPVPLVEKEERDERTNAKGTAILYSRLHVAYRFYAEDGSFVEAKVIGEAMDSGDKATNKAMSAAYKYACFQIFCIPTEEMLDSEKDTFEVKGKTPPKVSNVQITALRNLMARKGFPENTMLEFLKVKKLDDISMDRYTSVVQQLEGRPDKPQDTTDLGL